MVWRTHASSYGWTQEVRRARKSVRVGRGVAKNKVVVVSGPIHVEANFK